MEVSWLRADLARVKMERDIFGAATMVREGAQLKLAFIDRQRQARPISVRCGVLRSGNAGHREHCGSPCQQCPARHLSDDAFSSSPRRSTLDQLAGLKPA
jgi:hypothetical protein